MHLTSADTFAFASFFGYSFFFFIENFVKKSLCYYLCKELNLAYNVVSLYLELSHEMWGQG